MKVSAERFNDVLDRVTSIARDADPPEDRDEAVAMLQATVTTERELRSLAGRIRYALGYRCLDVPDEGGRCVDCGRRIVADHSPWPGCTDRVAGAVVRAVRLARLTRSLISVPVSAVPPDTRPLTDGAAGPTSPQATGCPTTDRGADR